jgi:hypothetical protein
MVMKPVIYILLRMLLNLKVCSKAKGEGPGERIDIAVDTLREIIGGRRIHFRVQSFVFCEYKHITN